jgi:hypothetical protein
MKANQRNGAITEREGIEMISVAMANTKQECVARQIYLTIVLDNLYEEVSSLVDE